MVHFHKHLHSAVSFYSISFCNTNTYTIFFRSRIRLYCISFEVNFYSVCRNAFRFQCFSNILGTSLGQLKVYCCITCIYICITCYANLCRRIFLQILNLVSPSERVCTGLYGAGKAVLRHSGYFIELCLVEFCIGYNRAYGCICIWSGINGLFKNIS